MDEAIPEEGHKWRCKEHPEMPSDIICLDGNAKDRFMCFMCLQINPVPIQNFISMTCVLAKKDNTILESYPPLKDQKLSDKLKHTILEQQQEEVDRYFKKLREDFEREVKASYGRAIELLEKQEQARQQVLEGYIRIAEIEKLKQLIVSDKEGAEKDLDDFIKDKWNKAEENRKIIQDLINENDQHFSSDGPIQIAQKMIDSLKSINFFEQSIKQEVNLIKSSYAHSQLMEISKIDNSIYQIKSGSSNGWGQVFLDPILNPLSKYILQIEFEMKPGNSQNCFFAGIVKDEGKDNGYAYSQNMCYYDYSNNYGITKYIKGNPMQSGSKQIGKHSFEIRIHLEQKLLRVASLPDYSSIAELDNPNKIDPKVNFRFFLAIHDQGNMIRINNVSVVKQFDGKM